MNKFSIDFNNLQTTLNKKKSYRLADVADRIEKVAFDVVRFIDSDKLDDLWVVQNDGKDEYIVAMYDEDPQVKQASIQSSNPWSTKLDSKKEAVYVFYNDAQIKKIIAEDTVSVSRFLSVKLAEDADFRNKFINHLTSEEKEVLAAENSDLVTFGIK